ncbi:hypothetical protein [Actinokineospora enzanensis]|uniref:hypothetical protein n=1 Tax=Actinokineospora enzanensis TaxID=155975 RepID=UPI0012EB5B46|nr:hypothetical protein [Actinokineospora enzanensis]
MTHIRFSGVARTALRIARVHERVHPGNGRPVTRMAAGALVAWAMLCCLGRLAGATGAYRTRRTSRT